MNHRKEHFTRAVRILALIAAVILSIVLPRLWQSSYDARIENKPEQFSANVTTYEMQYKSFTQKMELLAACETRGIGLELLAVEDYAEVMTAEQLAKIVREQLEELEENVKIYDFPTEQITASAMNGRVKYVMYTLTDQINISGIEFWEVSYQIDDLEISLKLDSEFYKIYGLQVSGGSVYNEDWTLWEDLAKSGNYAKAAEGYDTFSYSSNIYDEVLTGLLYYWELTDNAYSWVDIAENTYYADDPDDRWIGVVEFFEEADLDELLGQGNSETEETAADTSVYDEKEESVDAENDANEINDWPESSRLNIELNLYNNWQGFGLLIQK